MYEALMWAFSSVCHASLTTDIFREFWIKKKKKNNVIESLIKIPRWLDLPITPALKVEHSIRWRRDVIIPVAGVCLEEGGVGGVFLWTWQKRCTVGSLQEPKYGHEGQLAQIKHLNCAVHTPLCTHKHTGTRWVHAHRCTCVHPLWDPDSVSLENQYALLFHPIN